MNKAYFLDSLYKNFSNVSLNYHQFTLFEANFYDWSVCKTFSDYKTSDLIIELKDFYSDDIINFYLRNLDKNGKYVEPFISWNNIPTWYFIEFNDGGIINLESENFLYYLCSSIFLDLSELLSFHDWMERIDYPLKVMDEVNFFISYDQRNFLKNYFKFFKNKDNYYR